MEKDLFNPPALPLLATNLRRDKTVVKAFLIVPTRSVTAHS